MKKVIIVLSFLLLFSCNKIKVLFNSDFNVISSKIIQDSEDAIYEEQKANLDFSTHIVETSDMEDANIYKELQGLIWHTSYAKSPGSPHAKKGGVFYTYLNDVPNTFRYMGPSVDGVSKKLFHSHLSLLSRSDYDRGFLPALATHWAFGDDGKTVYYKLNKKAKWSDGVPCTVDDIIFAVDFATSKDIAPFLEELVYSDISIKKISKEYVSIKTSENVFNSKELLLDVTNITPRPKHFYDGKSLKNWVIDYNRIAEPTTGPYYLDSWEQDYGLSFKKASEWWAEEYEHFQNVYNFDFVEFRILAGTQRSVRRYFRREALDALPITNNQEYLDALDENIKKRGLGDIWRVPYKSIRGLNALLFNTKTPLLDNIFFRRAMEYVIDIEGLLENVLTNEYERSHTMGSLQSCDGISFNNQDIKLPSYDKKIALELLEKAGFDSQDKYGIRKNKNGDRAAFTILYTDKNLKDEFGYLYARALECGVELDFVFVSGGILDKIKNGEFAGWWTSFSSSYVPNHYHLLHSLQSTSPPYLSNVFGFSHPSLDSLLENYNKEDISMEEKAKINKKIEEFARKQVLFIPTYYPITKKVLCWKYIRFPGWSSMPYMEDFGTFFAPLAWYDDEIKKEVDNAIEENRGFETREWKIGIHSNDD